MRADDRIDWACMFSACSQAVCLLTVYCILVYGCLDLTAPVTRQPQNWGSRGWVLRFDEPVQDRESRVAAATLRSCPWFAWLQS
jgi:hypothetical protein